MALSIWLIVKSIVQSSGDWYHFCRASGVSSRRLTVSAYEWVEWIGSGKEVQHVLLPRDNHNCHDKCYGDDGEPHHRMPVINAPGDRPVVRAVERGSNVPLGLAGDVLLKVWLVKKRRYSAVPTCLSQPVEPVLKILRTEPWLSAASVHVEVTRRDFNGLL